MFESTLSKRFLTFSILFILAMLCTLAYAEEPDPTPPADAVALPADGDIAPPEESGGETPAEEIPETLAEEETPVPTIWDKPFTDYTPTEGYLCLLFILFLSVCAFKLFKGGF